MDPLENLAQALGEIGLSRVRDELLKLALPAVRLRSEPVESDSLAFGDSRLGGDPDLPVGMEWPHSDADRPMSFVGQFRLSEVQHADRLDMLPASGIVWLFYDTGIVALGPKDSGRRFFSVHFEPNEDAELVRASMPRKAVGRWAKLLLGAKPAEPFGCARVSFEPLLSLPYRTPEVESLGLDEEEDEALFKLLYPEGMGGLHQIGGHAMAIQEDVRGDCVHTFQDTKLADWRLVLQIDTDDGIGMMWGDAGMIYLMSRPSNGGEDLGTCWLDLQCH